jgi:5-methylcytosine-specific restriction endonuclease McrA
MQNRAFQASLHERALLLAKTFLRVEADLLDAINDVDLNRVFESFGLTSTYAYCTKILELSEGATFYFISVARKSREVPELALAIEQGDLTVSKAARVVAVLTPENQEELIEKASTMTKNEIEKEVARRAPEKKRRARLKAVGENRERLTIELTNKCIEKLKRVRELESQRTSKASSLEDAIEKALYAYLQKHDPVKKAERSKMNPSKAKPSRKLDAKTKHEVMKRDQHECQERVSGEKCRQARWLDVHHIIEVQNGGTSELSNLITLCRCHHRLRHKHSAQAESQRRWSSQS